MHEMALCESVIEIIAEEAKRHAFTRVRAVRLEIGTLGSVEPEAMRFCFDAVSRGTVAESARLEVIDVPGRAWCMSCSTGVVITRRLDPCPECGGYQLQVTAGDDLRVRELEVE